MLQNASASNSADYINVVPIDDLEGLFNSETETETELHTPSDSVVDSYRCGNTSTNVHQVPVDEEFIAESVVYDKKKSIII